MKLTKYCANGNDFLIYNAITSGDLEYYDKLAVKLCARHSGIGADGLVIVQTTKGQESTTPKPAYQWLFFNQDGSRASMCGNASRCVGHFAYTQGIAPLHHTFLSDKGIIEITIDTQNNDIVESSLGKCEFLNEVKEESIWGNDWYLLDSGVPHLICFSNDNALPTSKDNAFLAHLRQKYNANVNVAFANDKENVSYITFERGVEDITGACGTGACAVGALGVKLGILNPHIKATPPSKEMLQVRIDSKYHTFLQGRVSVIALCEAL
ncbi:diaminopimelate epimerase [Helicobacter sp. 23-1046]